MYSLKRNRAYDTNSLQCKLYFHIRHEHTVPHFSRSVACKIFFMFNVFVISIYI